MLKVIREIIRSYTSLPKQMINLFKTVLSLQIVLSAFFILLNFKLIDSGFSDDEIADFLKYRFLTIIVVTLIIGLLVKYRRLLPILWLSAIMVPLSSGMTLYAISESNKSLIYLSLILMGVGMAGIKIGSVPYILRNIKKEEHTTSIALHHVCWGLSGIITGFLGFGIPKIAKLNITIDHLLIAFVLVGLLSIWFLFKIPRNEIVPNKSGKENFLQQLGSYDWRNIVRVCIPTLIIAMGAGLTIPYMNVFFNRVFGMTHEVFSLTYGVTSIIVVSAAFLVPTIKKKVGYHGGITVTQGVAVLVLVALAFAGKYHMKEGMFALAVLFFIIRQPLMNMGSVMISELDMYYVDERSRELVGSLAAAIWSGSWFVSAEIFRQLRLREVEYHNIFLLTAGMYAIGVFIYYFIILSYNKRTNRSGE